MSTDIFESAIAAGKDLGAFFECDDEAGYFYLCAMDASQKPRVLNAIHMVSGKPSFSQDDVAVRWDIGDKRVGLFIKDILWAVFDRATNAKYGGNYRAAGTPDIPSHARFST